MFSCSQAEDFGQSNVVNGLLGVAAESVVLVDEMTKEVIFTVPCRAVIGWTSQSNRCAPRDAV